MINLTILIHCNQAKSLKETNIAIYSKVNALAHALARARSHTHKLRYDTTNVAKVIIIIRKFFLERIRNNCQEFNDTK